MVDSGCNSFKVSIRYLFCFVDLFSLTQPLFLGNILLLYCYFPPNEPIADFQIKLNNLEDKIQEIGGKIVVVGDFNARDPEWGMPYSDSRGTRVLRMAARLGLNILNEGRTSPFRRPGYQETIPDISMTSEELTEYVKGWAVTEDYTGSDHQ